MTSTDNELSDSDARQLITGAMRTLARARQIIDAREQQLLGDA